MDSRITEQLGSYFLELSGEYMCPLGKDGADYLALALTRTDTIDILVLIHNAISHDGIGCIAEALGNE